MTEALLGGALGIVLGVCVVLFAIWILIGRDLRPPKPYDPVRDREHWLAWVEQVAAIQRCVGEPLGFRMKTSKAGDPYGEGQYSIFIWGTRSKIISPGDVYDPATGVANLSAAIAFMLEEE